VSSSVTNLCFGLQLVFQFEIVLDIPLWTTTTFPVQSRWDGIFLRGAPVRGQRWPIRRCLRAALCLWPLEIGQFPEARAAHRPAVIHTAIPAESSLVFSRLRPSMIRYDFFRADVPTIPHLGGYSPTQLEAPKTLDGIFSPSEKPAHSRKSHRDSPERALCYSTISKRYPQ